MAEVYGFLDNHGVLSLVRAQGSEWVAIGNAEIAGLNSRNVLVFVDGRETLCLHAVLPSQTDKEARRAAPFAIEDELAVSIDDVHVAVGPAGDGPDAGRQIVATAKDQMQIWLAQLAKAGLPDAQLIAAPTVLPERDLMIDCDDVILGRVGDKAFALEKSFGSEVFASLIGRQSVEVYGETLAEEIGQTVTGGAIETPIGLLHALAGWHRAAPVAPMLRQGALSVRANLSFAMFREWRIAGALVAAVAACFFIATLFELYGLAQRKALLEQRLQGYVEAGWPAAEGDVERALALASSQKSLFENRGQPSPLTMLALLYQALEEGNNGDLKSIRYQSQRQEILVRIGFSDFVSVDQLSARLSERGMLVTTGNARQNGSQVIGELTLRGSNE